jgi:hypothetical protein
VLHEPKTTNRKKKRLLPDFAQALLFERGIAPWIAASAPRAARKIVGISGRTIFTRPTAAMGLIPSLGADLTALQIKIVVLAGRTLGTKKPARVWRSVTSWTLLT